MEVRLVVPGIRLEFPFHLLLSRGTVIAAPGSGQAARHHQPRPRGCYREGRWGALGRETVNAKLFGETPPTLTDLSQPEKGIDLYDQLIHQVMRGRRNTGRMSCVQSEHT